MVPEGISTDPIEILNDGFVRLVDVMGDDSAVVQAARVSYGEGTKRISEDRTLIRFLMRHRHTTPLEMCEIKFHIRAPMDCWRQWIRHRTASVNEYSTRYSEAIDSRQTTEPDEWRLQSGTNKQGSSGYVDAGMPRRCNNDGEGLSPSGSSQPPTGGHLLTAEEAEFHAHAQRVYQQRLDHGVAREQARKDLPLSTYTMAYWKIDLHNLLHFLSLRMDSHAQHEIRLYANAMGGIVAQLFPNVWEAFRDYRLEAMQLTRLDIAVIQAATALTVESGTAIEDVCTLKEAAINAAIERVFDNKREAGECREKLQQLGLLP